MVIIKHRFMSYLNARIIFIYFIYLIHCNFEVSLTDIGFFYKESIKMLYLGYISQGI